MSYNVNEGGDHRQYINPYDNAVVTCYISLAKNSFTIRGINGYNLQSTLLIDLEALCAPQGPVECLLPDTIANISVGYSKIVFKNMGSINRIVVFDFWWSNEIKVHTLYFSGRTNIVSFFRAEGANNIGTNINICADQEAIAYSGLTTSNFVSTIRSIVGSGINISIANPPARPGGNVSENTWIKVNGDYLQAKNYMKIEGEWRPVSKVYYKVNGVWKLTTALKTYYYCDVYDEDSGGWFGDWKRGGFSSYFSDKCEAYETNRFKTNEVFMAVFKFPPLEGFNSKECYICNGSESSQYELINASSIDTGIYKMQFTGSVFKVIS